MAVGGLGEGDQAGHLVPEDRRPLAGARNVGDRERELTRARGEPGDSLVERAKPADRVEEVIEGLGVVIELALAGLGVDREQPREGVGLGQRQVDVQERVAVSAPAFILLAAVQADRDLHADRLAAVLEPAAQAAGDRRQHHVVDGDALASAVLDRLQARQREGPPGDLAVRTDVAVEGGVRARAQLAAQGTRDASRECGAALGRLGPRPPPRAARGAPRRHGARAWRRIPEQLADQADVGDAVGHRVVHAADQGGAAVADRDHVDPPQRPIVIEALGQQLARQLTQPRLVQRLRGCLGDVPVQVGVGLDPGRGRGPGVVHPAAQPGQGGDPLGDALAQAGWHRADRHRRPARPAAPCRCAP